MEELTALTVLHVIDALCKLVTYVTSMMGTLDRLHPGPTP